MAWKLNDSLPISTIEEFNSPATENSFAFNDTTPIPLIKQFTTAASEWTLKFWGGIVTISFAPTVEAGGNLFFLHG